MALSTKAGNGFLVWRDKWNGKKIGAQLGADLEAQNRKAAGNPTPIRVPAAEANQFVSQ